MNQPESLLAKDNINTPLVTLQSEWFKIWVKLYESLLQQDVLSLEQFEQIKYKLEKYWLENKNICYFIPNPGRKYEKFKNQLILAA